MDQSGSIEPSGIPMQGTVASGFEEVAEAFARAVAMSPRGGAALHVRQDSRVVADLWGGFADEGREWSADTLTVLASCTKAVVAILMGELVREGRLQLDVPVAQYWPEFAAKGKGPITVREALAHRAGLPWVRQDLVKSDLVDPLAMAAILADEEPMFAPGTTHLYHALTYGWIAGEIVRRVTGSRSASYFANAL